MWASAGSASASVGTHCVLLLLFLTNQGVHKGRRVGRRRRVVSRSRSLTGSRRTPRRAARQISQIKEALDCQSTKKCDGFMCSHDPSDLARSSTIRRASTCSFRAPSCQGASRRAVHRQVSATLHRLRQVCARDGRQVCARDGLSAQRGGGEVLYYG